MIVFCPPDERACPQKRYHWIAVPEEFVNAYLLKSRKSSSCSPPLLFFRVVYMVCSVVLYTYFTDGGISLEGDHEGYWSGLGLREREVFGSSLICDGCRHWVNRS